MKTARLLVLMGLFVTAAAPARAASIGWWGYLERLSGPGPFIGRIPSWEVEATCIDSQNELLPPWKCWFPREEIKHRFMIRFGTGSTADDRQLFFDSKDDRREVRAHTFEIQYLHRPIPAVEVGAGYGQVQFSGDLLRATATAPAFEAFSFNRNYLPLTVSVAPAAFFNKSPWASVVRLEGGEKIFFNGFLGKQFGDSVTKYESGAEVVPSFRIVVDVSAVVFARRK